jgi:hypothetical protein
MSESEQKIGGPVNMEREPRKTAIAKILKEVRTDLINLKLITRDSTVIIGWNNIFADLRSTHRRDRVYRTQFSSANPIRLGMVEITRITNMNWEELRKARELSSAGSERVEDTAEIASSFEVLLSRPAITSLLEQVLSPVDKKTA